tara:strand:+ start:279 stop:641 length:363 start_codon:yes stop_codon:yes gene_type:complete
MDMKKIFVYGTLKQGKSNHEYYLGESKFLGAAKTDRDIWGLADLGAYPAMTYGRTQVSGEVYEVDQKTLSRIDRLEGVENGLYMRDTIVVDIGGEKHHCDTYLMLDAVKFYPNNKLKSEW